MNSTAFVTKAAFIGDLHSRESKALVHAANADKMLSIIFFIVVLIT